MNLIDDDAVIRAIGMGGHLSDTEVSCGRNVARAQLEDCRASISVHDIHKILEAHAGESSWSKAVTIHAMLTEGK